MRALRLYAPSLTGDHTLCYIHADSAGESCVNEVRTKITYAEAGTDLLTDHYSDKMTIVLPCGTGLGDGDFLAVEDGDLLLRWEEASGRFKVVKPGFLSVSARVSVWKTIRTAILTVSDKGSRGEREDTAGPELERLVTGLGGVVSGKMIVPDERDVIARTLKEWCGEGFDLILTTGGTGLSQRDVTPEALMDIAEKTVPGFGEMMRMRTLKYTERAFLTRSLAVICGKTLVIAFPGSRRGAAQCFEAIAPALRHGVEILAGWDAECGGHRHCR
ncbi:MAG TPA: MogA/MoaB family molybdenum cofactor biosynthesis protein [Synergistaceae bacterium]|mgnify:CR=1 FL=1|jgi:molybdopterin adenylyltransferase|nr:MogA/MoaB family molybdenum cofactor biosynthesis protein [Synergistaceae bacterium]HPX03491.1 MogA/MoaB family molybdenum cofactor biosynthesis protein [Synergistaceae bacterium]HQA54377.1 MogA/MoaB family molybdenum cofactor biosynthesis protein [Synergistaceae bacterium]